MSSKRKWFAAVTLFVLMTQAVAQQSAQRVVIRAGHVLDVKSGKMLSDQAIVIPDSRWSPSSGNQDR